MKYSTQSMRVERSLTTGRKAKGKSAGAAPSGNWNFWMEWRTKPSLRIGACTRLLAPTSVSVKKNWHDYLRARKTNRFAHGMPGK